MAMRRSQRDRVLPPAVLPGARPRDDEPAPARDDEPVPDDEPARADDPPRDEERGLPDDEPMSRMISFCA
jgi:hypothetical protein